MSLTGNFYVIFAVITKQKFVCLNNIHFHYGYLSWQDGGELFMVNMYNIYKSNKIKEVIYQLLWKNL